MTIEYKKPSQFSDATAIALRKRMNLSDTIYVVMSGQSNAVGWTLNTGGDLTTNSDVSVWNTLTATWEVATSDNVHDPLQNTVAANNNSIGWQFCKVLNELTGRPVRYLVSALGATKLEEWADGGSQMLALDAAILASGITSIDYFLWHQGESDAVTAQATYQTDLLAFFETIKAKDYFERYTKILCGELLDGANDAQNETYGNIAFLADKTISVVDSKGLVGHDANHFTGADVDTFAERYVYVAFGINKMYSRISSNNLEDSSNLAKIDTQFPLSSIDNVIARFDGITGKIIQVTGVSISDSDGITTSPAGATYGLTVNGTYGIRIIGSNALLDVKNADSSVNFRLQAEGSSSKFGNITESDFNVMTNNTTRISIDGTTGVATFYGDINLDTAKIKFAASSFLQVGAGTPEGSITAPVGSLYTRTDGGSNTTLYVKESGIGNTGWIAK